MFRPRARVALSLCAGLLASCSPGTGEAGRKSFDLSALDTLPGPLARWYDVPPRHALTALKFAFRSLDYAQQADSNIAAFAEVAGGTPAVAGAYVDLRVKPERLRAFLEAVRARGSVPSVTFDPKDFANPDTASQFGYLEQVRRGAWDAKIREVASVVRDFGSPVLMRWAHEMNGDWYPYSGTFTGGGDDRDGDGKADGPQRYVEAWRRVHGLFAQEGATEVAWVYSPSAESFPDREWNGPYAYYPGSAYVDLIAIDLYEHPGNERLPMAALLDGVYRDLARFWGRHAGDTAYALRPFGLGEFGTAREDASAQADWYVAAVTTLAADPRIVFHALYNDRNGRKDFRVHGMGDRLQGPYSDPRHVFAPLPSAASGRAASKAAASPGR